MLNLQILTSGGGIGMRLTLPTTKLGAIWSMRILPVEKRDASYSPAAVTQNPSATSHTQARHDEGGA